MIEAQDRPIHGASDNVEPRLARGFSLALQRLRERIPVAALERALAAGDVAAAAALIARVDVEDAFIPSGEIVADAVVRGGKIAAEDMP